MNKFNFNGKAIFLTYKTHLTQDNCNVIFANYDVKYNAVHETSDKEHGYDHTHILVWFNKKTHIRNCRALDFGDIHPHIKIVKTSTHWSNLVNYIRKQNEPFIVTLTGNEYEWLGTTRDLIQGHKCWGDVVNDDGLAIYLRNYMAWAKECWAYRPQPNLTSKITLRDWQQTIVERLSGQNDRQILWVYDKDGGKGKSVLTNWLMDNKNAYMFNGGRMGDIAHAYNNQEFIVVDLPRSMDTDFTPYKAMECFKDGRIFSPKYNSCMKRFAPAKVIVFSNNMPDVAKMSRDRWDIVDIRTSRVVPVSLNIKETPVLVKKAKAISKKRRQNNLKIPRMSISQLKARANLTKVKKADAIVKNEGSNNEYDDYSSFSDD